MENTAKVNNGLLKGQCPSCIFGINGQNSCHSGRELAKIAGIGGTVTHENCEDWDDITLYPKIMDNIENIREFFDSTYIN